MKMLYERLTASFYVYFFVQIIVSQFAFVTYQHISWYVAIWQPYLLAINVHIPYKIWWWWWWFNGPSNLHSQDTKG